MKTIGDISLTKKEQERMIKGKLKIYGYSYGAEPMKIDRSFHEVMRILDAVPDVMGMSSFLAGQMDEKTAIASSREFFDSYLNVHDVRTIASDDYANLVEPYLCEGVKPNELLELCDILESSSEMVNPFDLPVSYFSGTSAMNGITKKPMYIINNDKYLRKQNVYFSEIALGVPISMMTPYTYNHEITHTQVESVKGSVRDYHNREVLPILIELISAYEMDLSKQQLSLMIKIRLRDILQKMALLHVGNGNLNNMLDNTIYVKSTLQALHLFDIYVGSSIAERREMIDGVQAIFDGKLVLETFMMKYGVEFKRSSDASMVKKHIRKYI